MARVASLPTRVERACRQGKSECMKDEETYSIQQPRHCNEIAGVPPPLPLLVVAHGVGEHAVLACHRGRGARGVQHGHARQAHHIDGRMHAHTQREGWRRQSAVYVRMAVVMCARRGWSRVLGATPSTQADTPHSHHTHAPPGGEATDTSHTSHRHDAWVARVVSHATGVWHGMRHAQTSAPLTRRRSGGDPIPSRGDGVSMVSVVVCMFQWVRAMDGVCHSGGRVALRKRGGREATLAVAPAALAADQASQGKGKQKIREEQKQAADIRGSRMTGPCRALLHRHRRRRPVVACARSASRCGHAEEGGGARQRMLTRGGIACTAADRCCCPLSRCPRLRRPPPDLWWWRRRARRRWPRRRRAWRAWRGRFERATTTSPTSRGESRIVSTMPRSGIWRADFGEQTGARAERGGSAAQEGGAAVREGKSAAHSAR